MDLETQLREQIRAIYEDAQRRAEPLWRELVALESLRPLPVFVIPADLADSPEIHNRLQDLRVWDGISATHSPSPPPRTPGLPLPSRPPDTSATDTAD